MASFHTGPIIQSVGFFKWSRIVTLPFSWQKMLVGSNPVSIQDPVSSGNVGLDPVEEFTEVVGGVDIVL